MRLLALFVLLTVSNCGPCDAELTRYCASGLDCWPRYQAEGFTTGQDMPRTPAQGECFPGVTICIEGEQRCDNPILPEPEECDGLDNDCDGDADEGIGDREFYNGRNTCDLCGLCSYATQVCAAGQWQCVPLIPPTAEQCNDLDDDCDCVIDNGLAESTYYYPEEEFPLTVGVGQCRPGVSRCVDGVAFRTDPVVPSEEFCDGEDNDCDGLVDEATDQEAKAFLLVIDVSGSMASEIDAVRLAICDFAQAADVGSQFAVVMFGAGPPAPYISLMQEFAGPTATCATMEDVGNNVATGTEYAIEGILVADGLTWPGFEEQTVLVFTDEELQIYGDVSSEDDVASLCGQVPFDLGIYTYSEHFSDWSPMVTLCGGFTAVLEADRLTFSITLLNRFFGNCAN